MVGAVSSLGGRTVVVNRDGLRPGFAFVGGRGQSDLNAVFNDFRKHGIQPVLERLASRIDGQLTQHPTFGPWPVHFPIADLLRPSESLSAVSGANDMKLAVRAGRWLCFKSLCAAFLG